MDPNEGIIVPAEEDPNNPVEVIPIDDDGGDSGNNEDPFEGGGAAPDEVAPDGVPARKRTLEEKRADRRRLATSGDIRVLAVRVIASNAEPSFDLTELSDSVFGTDGDPLNLKSQMGACSNGAFNVLPALTRNPDENISPTYTPGIRDGVIEVRINVAVDDNRNDEAMRTAATNELKRLFSVSSPELALANHIMYCLPDGSMSSIAYAFVGGWMSVYSDRWCTYPTAQVNWTRVDCPYIVFKSISQFVSISLFHEQPLAARNRSQH